ncbi:hypothetical protein FRC12_021882 [Ceratobasidium sp. 428]|nr:hypothetical protein FRC12_021882 [Ceratobasidium sp. 428]
MQIKVNQPTKPWSSRLEQFTEGVADSEVASSRLVSHYELQEIIIEDQIRQRFNRDNKDLHAAFVQGMAEVWESTQPRSKKAGTYDEPDVLRLSGGSGR